MAKPLVALLLLTVAVTSLPLCAASSSDNETAPAAKQSPVPVKQFSAAQKRWWAIQPVTKQEPPAVKDPQQQQWVRNEIDAFVLDKLQAKGLRPNPPADKITRLRRVTLDLTGLPPTPEETQAFLSDESPQAWEKVVDRLLASPRYGERWARHWLDLARYADSEGFKADETRPNIWRYRDYVIKSLNDDKPYDRFVKEQIAGDELYPGNPDALIATGFNRHFPDESNAAHLMLRRQELLNDITDTVGATFLGVTVGCARCHDHKFDPILQRDYYRLQAFFANTRSNDVAVLDDSARQQEYAAQYAVWNEKTRDIRRAMQEVLKPRRDALFAERFSRFPDDIQAILILPAAQRTAYQWQMFEKALPQLTFPDAEIAKLLRGEAVQQYKELDAQLAHFASLKPKPLAVAQAMVDQSGTAPQTFVLRAGNWDAPGDEVQPGFLTILDPNPAPVVTPSFLRQTTGRRTALANWLASPDNPLSTRVIVNRVWHYHFGRGIAGTPSDFGLMGERPTHRELLDDLTAKFIAEGWSLKKLHRLILTSNTYQQSSAFDEASAKADPDDKLLWRYPRHRLEGEALRDSMLAVSGQLNQKMFGPGVFPPIPDGIAPNKSYPFWKMEENPDEANRRSVYVFVRRNLRYPLFQAFDMPDTHETCARRTNTVTPTQSLALMNDALVLQWSQALAARVANDPGLTPANEVERAYRLTYSRPPSPDERDQAVQFLAQQQTIVGGDHATALTDLCHMLMSSNEFLYVN